MFYEILVRQIFMFMFLNNCCFRLMMKNNIFAIWSIVKVSNKSSFIIQNIISMTHIEMYIDISMILILAFVNLDTYNKKYLSKSIVDSIYYRFLYIF